MSKLPEIWNEKDPYEELKLIGELEDGWGSHESATKFSQKAITLAKITLDIIHRHKEDHWKVKVFPSGHDSILIQVITKWRELDIDTPCGDSYTFFYMLWEYIEDYCPLEDNFLNIEDLPRILESLKESPSFIKEARERELKEESELRNFYSYLYMFPACVVREELMTNLVWMMSKPVWGRKFRHPLEERDLWWRVYEFLDS